MRIRLRRYICVLCCLLLLLRQTPGHAQEPEPGELYAQAAVLMDADSGRVLYDKNGAQVLAMASTTKIMTCILALELADPQETVEISAYAASMPKVKLYVQKGERYLLEDLLYSLMLESHNDAAVAIAEHLGRKYLPEQLGEKSPSEYSPEESRQAVEAFAAVMNRKAAELGCGDTWFITPNGLDATQVLTLENGETVEKRHSTTARDLASIMCYCIRRSPRSQAFLEITQTPSHSFSIDNGRSFSCANHNAFLQMMQGAISGKTGFTNQAGYCYVGALERDGRTLVVALLACGWPNNKGYKWSDTRILMNFGLNDFAYHSYQGTGADGEDQEIEGLLLRDGEEIRVECHMERQLQAPVEAGKQVGTIQYIFQDQVYREEHIVTTRAVREIDYRWCFQQIMRYFLL